MDFKTSYFKLAEILSNLSEQISANKDTLSRLTEIMTEQSIDAHEWENLSFTYGDDGTCFGLELYDDGVHLLENMSDRGLVFPYVHTHYIHFEEEALVKLKDGTKTTVTAILCKYSSYVGSLNVQYEAAREALNGDYSISNLTSYAQSVGALKAPSLMNTVSNITSSMGSNSGNFVPQLLQWFKNTYSNLKGEAKEEDASIDWSESDYSSKSIAGGVIFKVIGGAISLLGMILSFASRIIGIVLACVGTALQYVTSLITENVNAYAEYNDAAGINAYNLRLNYGTFDTIASAGNAFGSQYHDQVVNHLTTSKLCVVSGGLWSAYLWIADDQTKVNYEIYPTAIGVTNNGLMAYASALRYLYSFDGHAIKVSAAYDDALFAFNNFCKANSSEFKSPSESTSDELRNGLLLNLLACTTFAIRTGYSRDTWIDPADAVNVDDIHYCLLWMAVAGNILSISNWDILKKYCGIINETNDDYFLNYTLSGFVLTPFKVTVIDNRIYEHSMIPFLLAKGNFAVMVPTYSENWLANTIWTMVGIAAAVACVCVAKFQISRALNKMVTRQELKTESLQYAYEDDQTPENFQAYWKNKKKCQRLYKFTGQAGLGYYASDDSDGSDSVLATAAESISDTDNIIHLISNGSL